MQRACPARPTGVDESVDERLLMYVVLTAVVEGKTFSQTIIVGIF